MKAIKINQKGQITIPKAIREKYGWDAGIQLDICEGDAGVTIKPINYCFSCKRALKSGSTCPHCKPKQVIVVY